MTNANDVSAKWYDSFTFPLRPSDLTELEVKLIKKIATSQDKILDLGCGTGRHLLPLVADGYDVMGIDSSKGMLDVLKTKSKHVKTYLVDDIKQIDSVIPSESVNLTILMWNAINELALSNDDLIAFWETISMLTVPGGKLLVNTEDTVKLIPDTQLSYSYDYADNQATWNINCELVDYDTKTNTTKTRETVTRKLLAGGDVDKTQTVITQRWWSWDELLRPALPYGWQVSQLIFPQSEELYLLFAKG